MTTTLDIVRFSKVRALHDSTDQQGEQDAAAGRMQALAHAAGLTVAEAVATVEAPAVRRASSSTPFADMFSDFLAERERERSEKWRRVIAEYGSERAVFEQCAWEQALEKACAPFRVRRFTTGWPVGSLWGWHQGSVGDPAPPIIEAICASYPMPETVRQAWAEYAFWDKLAADREARGVGMGDPALGVVIRVRLLEPLLNTLPAHSLNDVRARLAWLEFWSTCEVDQEIEDHRATLATLRADIERMAALIPRTAGAME